MEDEPLLQGKDQLSSSGYDIDDDDEEICRICRCGEEDSRPLFHPCICTGSIRYVHEDCLLEWLSHSSTSSSTRSKCELCGHSFGFTPVYEPGAPSSLSFVEIASLFVVRVLKTVPFIFRVIVVCITWGIFIPIATCVMFRILSLSKLDRDGSFHNAYENAQSSWASFFLRLRMALEGGYYVSWGIGVCASASIFLSFLTLISVVDFVREHDMLTDTDEQFEEEEEDEIIEDVVEEPGWIDDDDGNDFFGGGPAGNENDELDNDQDEQQQPDFEEDEEDEDDENEHNVGDLNVALDELLGLRGQGWVLFHNVLWLLTFNGLYLCVALFAPTTVGAVVLSVSARVVKFLFKIDLMSDEDEAFLLRMLHRLRSNKQAEEKSRAEYLYGPWGDGVAQQLQGQSLVDVCGINDGEALSKRAFFEELHWIALEIGAVLIGYTTVACTLVCMYFCAKKLRDSGGVRSRRSWARITRVLKLMSRTFKVVIVVLLKMGIFPVLLGTLLEIAGRDLIHLGKIDRYAFGAQHPVFAFMVLWVAGITHMLVITVVVLELRDVLHPDILHGIIRPKDADDSLLRTVLEEPILKHVRRMALSCAIYTFLVIAFIYLPTKLVLASRYHWVLPYTPKLHYTALEIQLPIELGCIHIGVLNLLDQGKDHIRKAVEVWFKFVCKPLGLTGFLLPMMDESNTEDSSALLPRERPNMWVLRVAVISVFAWVTCLLATFVSVAAPLYVGRATVSLLQVPFAHEPLVYGIGCLVIWRLVVAAQVLRVHEAPHVLYTVLHRARAETSLTWQAMKGYVQWAGLLVVSLLLSPWLMGIFIQLEILLPYSYNHEVETKCSGVFGWQYPAQLHSLMINFSGGNSTTEMVNSFDFMDSSTSPLQNWMLGFAVEQFALINFVMLPNHIQEQREFFVRFNQRLLRAVQSVRAEYDCSSLLLNFVLPGFLFQIAALVGPVLLSGAVDMVVYFLTGYSCSHAYGIVQMFRRASTVLFTCFTLPYIGYEAQRTWRVVHDALRDERYLVGKRLHNMEKTQKRSVVI